MLKGVVGFILLSYSIFKLKTYIQIDKKNILLNDDIDIISNSALNWCISNFNYGINDMPELFIESNPEMEELGKYEISKKRIVVNKLKVESIESLVNVILHEYHHHLQNTNISRFQIDYSKSVIKGGYTTNLFELQANDFAEKYVQKCLSEL